MEDLLDGNNINDKSLFGLWLKSGTLIFFLVISQFSNAQESEPVNDFEFDGGMLVGGIDKNIKLSKLNSKNDVMEGKYLVDIYVNGVFVVRQETEFKNGTKGTLFPCVNVKVLLDGGVRSSSVRNKSESKNLQCKRVEDYIDGASSNFNLSELRLDLFIPNEKMSRVARGSVPLNQLSEGETALFLNYDTNYYGSRASGFNSSYSYLGMNSGVNLGLWQVRQQSTYSHYDSDTGQSSSNWNAIRTYVQRPVTSLGSTLTLGDSYTSGSLFSSLGFRGVVLETDDRMLPESQRGYAPTIRGIASTTAQVTVKQAGAVIYQITVPPGAFIIDDLYSTSYQGDLNVEVQEADGRTSSFTVPFAAVPDSMRAGRTHFNITTGKVRNILNSEAPFADLTLQTGLTNALTANGGLRFSQGYEALLGGGVLATGLGAFGVNMIYSQADLFGDKLNGWRLGATYSKTFTPTNTSLALAGYRYSTQNYLDLNDVLGIRAASTQNTTWSSDTYQQQEQIVASVGQSLGDYGQIYLSGSTSTYHTKKDRDTQYQFGYSKGYNGISYNISMSRQKTSNIKDYAGYSENVSGTTIQDIVMLSMSIPLGEGPRSPILSSGVSHDKNNNYESTSYQAALAGTLGEDQLLSYNVNGNYDTEGAVSSVGANLTQQTPIASLSASGSQGKNYVQGGAGIRGAFVVHSGGITLGPYVSDTFGIIEAEGAEGADVLNGLGAKINNSGYAIIPSLTPYRNNDIGLDAAKITDPNTELSENLKTVAPYAGSIVKVHFNTIVGYPLLIKEYTSEGREIPLGTDIYDEKNEIVGLVGQGNQIYARVPTLYGVLFAKWGDHSEKKCMLKYDLRKMNQIKSLYHLNAACK